MAHAATRIEAAKAYATMLVQTEIENFERGEWVASARLILKQRLEQETEAAAAAHAATKASAPTPIQEG